MHKAAILISATISGALVFASAAIAADKASMQAGTLPPKFIVEGKSISETPMAEWEANGAMKFAIGRGEIAKAPKSAVRYTVKSVAWPSGTVRVISFTKAGGVLHAITDETEIYVLKGAVTVNVGGTPTVLKQGDVASHASGAVHAGPTPEDTTLVTWTVGSLTPDAKPAVVRAADAPESGQPDVLKVKRYEFPGNSIRVATMVKGSKNGPASAKTNSLIYLKEGHVRFYEGDEVHEVHAGDFVWEKAGETHRWEHVDGGSFVTTTGIPKNTGPMSVSEAVDHPEKK